MLVRKAQKLSVAVLTAHLDGRSCWIGSCNETCNETDIAMWAGLV